MNKDGSHYFFQHPQGMAAKLQIQKDAKLFLLCLCHYYAGIKQKTTNCHDNRVLTKSDVRFRQLH